MCGRYTLTVSSAALLTRFEATGEIEKFLPRYNLAPGQLAPVVLLRGGERRVDALRWGLVPYWAKDPKIAYKLINARSETVSEKVSFRQAFEKRRCLVPADGFYEWRPGNQKIPYRTVIGKESLFAMAGLWERWQGPDGKELKTFTILTTCASPALKHLHDRMPVILRQEVEAEWLEADRLSPERCQQLLTPFSDKALRSYPVSTLVNSSKNDSFDCIRPVDKNCS